MNMSRIENAVAPAIAFSRLAAAGFFLVMVYTVVSIFATPTGDHSFNFQEGGTVTALSALFLAMGGAMGFITYFIGYHTRHPGRFLSLLLGCGLAFFAIDEQIQLHEAIDMLVLTPQFGESPASRNWNDLIVIGYGVVALGVFWVFRSAFLESRRFAILFAIAFACYIVHTAIDSIVIPQTAWKVVPEESFKLMCGYFLFLAMSSRLLDALGDLLGINTSQSVGLGQAHPLPAE